MDARHKAGHDEYGEAPYSALGEEEGALLAWIPRDVWLAAIAAAAVLLAALYEFMPVLAALLAVALVSAVVAVIVGRD